MAALLTRRRDRNTDTHRGKTTERHRREKMAKERGLRSSNPTNTLISDFHPPELWGSRFLLFKSLSLWYFVVAAYQNIVSFWQCPWTDWTVNFQFIVPFNGEMLSSVVFQNFSIGPTYQNPQMIPCIGVICQYSNRDFLIIPNGSTPRNCKRKEAGKWQVILRWPNTNLYFCHLDRL